MKKEVWNSGSLICEKYYAGSFVYNNEGIEYILFDEGRLTPKADGTYQYEYFLKDHLGNTRVVFTGQEEGLAVLQESHYYPFGMEFMGVGGEQMDITNYYKYNGKELQDDGFDLDGNDVYESRLLWYDYGARFYDAALGRFHTIDPLAETYIFQSPYVYAVNNPVRFTDFLGMGPEDEVKKTESIITDTNTNDETGITTVTEVTENSVQSTDRTKNEDGTTTTKQTTTTEIIKSTTEINSAGEIVSNSATTQTRKSVLVTQQNEYGVDIGGYGEDKLISGPTAVEGGYIGNKTEAIAVIASADNNERNGPWWCTRAAQDIFTGITAPAIAPANPGLQNRSGWCGVPYKSSGNYTREDSMRMQGRNYNGPKTDTSSSYHKAIYKKK